MKSDRDLFGQVPQRKLSFSEAMRLLRQRGWMVLPRVPRFPDPPISGRICDGCGKGRGCIPIAGNGYWHLRCWNARKGPVGRKTQRSHVQGRT